MGVDKPVGDITKLPKWAQDLIQSLEYQREAAVKALDAFTDSQTPSNCWVEEWPCTGEKPGPVTRRRYIQATEVTMHFKGQEITMRLRDGEWSSDKCIEISAGTRGLVFKPYASNVIRIYPERD